MCAVLGGYGVRLISGRRQLLRIVLLIVFVCTFLSVSTHRAYSATATSPPTCAILGEAGDDLSGSSDGDHTVVVGDPATLVVQNTNVLPETVIFTPDGGSAQTATLWTFTSSH